MDANEEYVRQRWECASVWLPTHSYSNGTYEYRLGWTGEGAVLKDGFRTAEEAWQAAADFTRERLEEIRQLEEGIKLIQVTKTVYDWQEFLEKGGVSDGVLRAIVRRECCVYRILSVLESKLKELERGMKTQEDGR